MHDFYFASALNATYWPQPGIRRIHVGLVEDTNILVAADSQGRIVVQVQDRSRAIIFITQPLEILNSGMFFLEVCFSAEKDEVEVCVNRDMLLEASHAADRPYRVKSTPPKNKNLVLYEIPKFKGSSRSAEGVFLRTLVDLQQKIQSQDPYELLKSAGLLRLLLLDSPCLIDLANTARLKLTYRVQDTRESLVAQDFINKSDFWVTSLYLPEGKYENKISKARNGFIKCPVLYKDSQVITVEDVIIACANKKGGVHFDPSTPNKPGQAKIMELDNVIESMGLEPSAQALVDIAKVTLEAVKPLVDNLTGAPNSHQTDKQ